MMMAAAEETAAITLAPRAPLTCRAQNRSAHLEHLAAPERQIKPVETAAHQSHGTVWRLVLEQMLENI